MASRYKVTYKSNKEKALFLCTCQVVKFGQLEIRENSTEKSSENPTCSWSIFQKSTPADKCNNRNEPETSTINQRWFLSIALSLDVGRCKLRVLLVRAHGADERFPCWLLAEREMVTFCCSCEFVLFSRNNVPVNYHILLGEQANGIIKFVRGVINNKMKIT